MMTFGIPSCQAAIAQAEAPSPTATSRIRSIAATAAAELGTKKQRNQHLATA